jgi:hypothetical protein
MTWLVCLTKSCSVVGRSMRKGHRRHLIIGKILGTRCNGFSNTAILQDIWSMAAIDMIGGGGGMTTHHGRSPSSTWKSSMIAAWSEFGVCVIEVNWRRV